MSSSARMMLSQLAKINAGVDAIHFAVEISVLRVDWDVAAQARARRGRAAAKTSGGGAVHDEDFATFTRKVRGNIAPAHSLSSQRARTRRIGRRYVHRKAAVFIVRSCCTLAGSLSMRRFAFGGAHGSCDACAGTLAHELLLIVAEQISQASAGYFAASGNATS